MLAWKIAPALAAGNTVILKPASTTPLTAYLFADVVRQADLPPGVVNIITGPGEIGMELVTPSRREQGRVHRLDGGRQDDRPRRLAGTGKKVTLELGGKAANIVFDDAPLDQAIEGIINGIYFNQGEVCCAGSRLFVQESVYEPLIDKLKARLGTLRVGDPLDKNTDVGAINSAGQLAKVQELVDSGIAEGAEIFQPDCELPTRASSSARRSSPGSASRHRIAQEEIFGPVLSVLTFRTPEEAIEKANNTPYGLSAGVWTEKGSRIFKMVAAMKAGVVWANTFNRFDPTSPFGGYKESGYGREGGIHGLGAYLDLSGRTAGTADERRLGAARLMAPQRPSSDRHEAQRGPRLGPGAARGCSRWPRRTGRRRAATGSACGRPTSSTSAGRSRAPSPGARTRSSARRASCWPTPAAGRARTSATRSARRARRSRSGRPRRHTTARRSCIASPS